VRVLHPAQHDLGWQTPRRNRREELNNFLAVSIIGFDQLSREVASRRDRSQVSPDDVKFQSPAFLHVYESKHSTPASLTGRHEFISFSSMSTFRAVCALLFVLC
ncbi:unnamed protein product, partial [Ectocarpus sp. 12 AP-2014]